MRTVHVHSDTAIAPLLDAASTEPVVLVRNGHFFRLEACEPFVHPETYDPGRVIATLDELAGSLTTTEAEALIADLYAARERGSRPASRP